MDRSHARDEYSAAMRGLTRFLLVLVIASAMCACDRPRSSPIDFSHELVVGFANESPFSYLDYRTGELVGEAPAVLRRILPSLGGSALSGRLTDFGALVPGLKAKRFDLVAAGMYITPARCKAVLFSEPTYCVAEGLLVPAGNPAGLRDFDDLKRQETSAFAVVRGTAEHTALEELGLSPPQLVIYPDAPSAFDALRVGRVAAFAVNALGGRDLLRRAGASSGVELVMPPSESPYAAARGCGAFAFRKSDHAARDAVNRALSTFIGTPEHLSLVAPFGFTRAELPPRELTTRALCGE